MTEDEQAQFNELKERVRKLERLTVRVEDPVPYPEGATNNLTNKINKEWPLRCKLAELAGFKANPKNERALYQTEFDLNLRELFLEVCLRKPENAGKAYDLIRDLYK
jgi:hypothetical protein